MQCALDKYGNEQNDSFQGASVPRGWVDSDGFNHEWWVEVWTGNFNFSPRKKISSCYTLKYERENCYSSKMAVEVIKFFLILGYSSEGIVL